MAARIECEIGIAAPAPVVWEQLQDPRHRLGWDARIAGIEVLTAGPIGCGTRTRLAYGWRWLRAHVEVELVAFLPGRRSGVRGTFVSTGDTLAGSWQLEPRGPTTVWKSVIVLQGRGRFGWLRERLAAPVLRWLTARSQQNLRERAEAAAAA